MSSTYLTFVAVVVAVAAGLLPLVSAANEELWVVQKEGTDGDSGKPAFVKAFTVVAFAEIFDKTWFVTLILALQSGKRYAFYSSFAALAVHTVLAAALGFEIARLFKASTIDFMTAALFALFTILYAKDFYDADPEADMLKTGREEAGDGFNADECLVDKNKNDSSYASLPNTGATNAKSGGAAKSSSSPWSRMFGGFMVVFIAEWGDRTQFAMVGLHSSLPVVPVFLGSLLAFALLCLSAVCVAEIVANRSIRERHVFALVSLSFSVFTLVSLKSGFDNRKDGN